MCFNHIGSDLFSAVVERVGKDLFSVGAEGFKVERKDRNEVHLNLDVLLGLAGTRYEFLAPFSPKNCRGRRKVAYWGEKLTAWTIWLVKIELPVICAHL